MNELFQPLSIKNLTLKNRIVMPPMCMYCATETGMATEWHALHYATRAVGGVGLIIVEATGVSPEGRISSHDLGIWDDCHIEGLATIVKAVHANGGKIGIQISHAGRKCEAQGMDIEAPSSIRYSEETPVPREMNESDIRETVEQFKTAALRAEKAGFDLIQIHGAHGYLINEFLSPLTNHRQDQYGGGIENRVRFLKEILEAVGLVWPKEKPLEVRITAEDYALGGNQAEDLAAMLNLLQHQRIDSVNVSTGGLLPVVPKAFPGYQLPHAEIIKKATGLLVAAGGLLSDPLSINSVLAEGKADMIYLGRELLRHPYWALNTAALLEANLEWPEQYKRAKPVKR